MAKLISIVDDEPDILKLVSLNLEKAGFKTKKFKDAETFLESLKKDRPSLIILDLMLPGADGMDICRELKRDERFSSIPVIILTAKGDETDRVLGLETGADDYVIKPFSPKELTSRVKAVLRREIRKKESGKLEVGKILEIDPEKYQVCVEGERIDLTTTEFRILHLLVSQEERVFTRDQILDNLWGEDKAILDRAVDVHIAHLRKKLKKAGQFIKNVRGIGYKLEV
jgi:DNA-binding response OmpR family regulator